MLLMNALILDQDSDQGLTLGIQRQYCRVSCSQLHSACRRRHCGDLVLVQKRTSAPLLLLSQIHDFNCLGRRGAFVITISCIL